MTDTKSHSNTSGYSKDLFDTVVKNTAGNKIKLVEQILRWRGFLVQKRDERILLSIGSPYEDIILLKEYGIKIKSLYEQHKYGFGAEIIDPEKLDMEGLSELFQLPGINGMTGPGDFGGMWLENNWKNFQECAFGVKVPVKYLDPGIALLVKVMPLLGLHTVMSCDGHLENPPVIYFRSKYHFNWAKVILPQCGWYSWSGNLPDGYDPSSWIGFSWKIFNRGIGNNYGSPTEEWQRHNIYFKYQNIQTFCEHIMDTDIAEKSRYLKKQLRETDLELHYENTRIRSIK